MAGMRLHHLSPIARIAVLATRKRLHEPFALQPNALVQQRRPQLEQPLGTLLEHPEDRLPVEDVECDDPGFAVVGAFEPFGGVDELGFAGPAASWRTALSATGIPASHMTSTVHMFVCK